MLRLMRLTREERREERFGCTVVRPNATKSPMNNECPSSMVCRISHSLL
jgi:flavin reductase (DIM6/NTAB) family NADH-FMN oxidoreductase RutF